MKISLTLVLSALVAAAGLLHVPKAAAEIKPVSTASCQRYFKGPVMEPENSFPRKVGFYFHRDAPSAPPAGLIACSLNSGTGMNNGGMDTKVLSGKKYTIADYVEVLFDKTTGPNVAAWDAVTAICVIPTKYTLEYIYFDEG